MRYSLGLFFALCAGVAEAQTISGPAPIITQTPVSQIQGGTSFNPIQLPRWRACLAKVLQPSSTQQCTMLMVGDSTTYGVGSTSNSGNGTQPNLGDFVSLYMNQKGIPTNNNGVCGDGTVHGAQYRVHQSPSGYDLRFTDGAWTASTGESLGGYMFSSPTVNGSPVVFTPITSYNSAQAALYPAMTPNDFQVIWYQGSTNGTMTAQATGGTAVTLASNNSSTLATANIAASSVSANNTLTITFTTAVTGNPAWECEIAENTNIGEVNIINAGAPGGFMADWVFNSSHNYDALPTITTLAPTLAIIMPGVNDFDAGNSLSTFITNLQSWITSVESTSDVVLVSPFPTVDNLTLQAQYIAAEQSLAQSNNIPFVNLNGIFVSTSNMVTLGLSFDSAIHPNSPGYADGARELVNVVGTP